MTRLPLRRNPLQEEQRIRTRALVTQGALAVFAEHGFLGSSIEQILVRAGVSPGMPDDARSRETAASVREHLLTALEHLDDVEPLDGPPELVVWAWHLHELIDVATRRTGRP